MKKDTLRSILVAFGTLVATFFGLGEEVISQIIDLLVMLIFGAISLYNIVLSVLRPADDDLPKYMTDGQD